MALNQTSIKRIAARLDDAEMNREAIRKITDDHPELDWADAYAIQDALRERKLARGMKVTGLKMGLTSYAKMRQMNVSDPVYGFLTDYGACMDGDVIDTSSLIHPKVEAEIAFVTTRAIAGPGCHIGTVLAATDFVLPAIEVIDSRYENFRFDLKSVIADNTSAARFVVGGHHRAAADIDLKNLGVVMEKNGEIVATASGAAVLGHPAASVAMLANMLAERKQHIRAGTLILTGGVTEAIAVKAGDAVTARFQHLGSVSLRFA